MNDGEHEAEKLWSQIYEFTAALSAGFGNTIQAPIEDVSKWWFVPPSSELDKSGLSSLAEAFRQNHNRLRAMSRFPVTMFNHGRHLHNLDLSINAPAIPGTVEEMLNARAVDAALRKQLEEQRSYDTGVKLVTQHHHVASIVAFNSDQTVPAAMAFCGSLVIQAWTIFETVAEDLWVTAVNKHPARLSRLRGHPRSKYGKPRQTEQPKRDDQSVSLSANDLEEYRFDVSEHMGDILLRNKRVSFRAISGIREAYHRAFDKHADDVDSVLDDAGLQYTAAVRNVLAHKAGRVDGEFKEQTAGISGVPAVADGEVFPLTGQIVAELCDATMSCSGSLIRSVHEWIIGHPEKP